MTRPHLELHRREDARPVEPPPGRPDWMEEWVHATMRWAEPLDLLGLARLRQLLDRREAELRDRR